MSEQSNNCSCSGKKLKELQEEIEALKKEIDIIKRVLSR